MSEILFFDKMTEGKYRWAVDIEGTPFEIYIPKWRVPEEIPYKIKIQLYLLKDPKIPIADNCS